MTIATWEAGSNVAGSGAGGVAGPRAGLWRALHEGSDESVGNVPPGAARAGPAVRSCRMAISDGGGPNTSCDGGAAGGATGGGAGDETGGKAAATGGREGGWGSRVRFGRGGATRRAVRAGGGTASARIEAAGGRVERGGGTASARIGGGARFGWGSTRGDGARAGVSAFDTAGVSDFDTLRVSVFDTAGALVLGGATDTDWRLITSSVYRAFSRSAISDSAAAFRSFSLDRAGASGTLETAGNGSSFPGISGAPASAFLAFSLESSPLTQSRAPLYHSTGLAASGTDEHA